MEFSGLTKPAPHDAGDRIVRQLLPNEACGRVIFGGDNDNYRYVLERLFVGPVIKVKFVLDDYEDGDQFDGLPWFREATVDEILSLDAAGWASSFGQPIPIPFLDMLYFFRGKTPYRHLTSLFNRLVPNYGKIHEGPRGAAMVRIDSYAALKWLTTYRPEMMKRFERIRQLRAH